MKIQNIIVIAVVFITVSVRAQSKKQIRDLKVKSETETITLYKDGKESSTYKAEYQVFDKDGNTVQDITYNPDGTVHRKETDTYSGKNKTEEVVEHPNGGNDNPDNTPPKKYKKTSWKYNANGDKTEEDVYDAAGTLLNKTTFIYNNTGDKMFEVEYDGTGKVTKKTAYGYDTKGLKTEKKVFGPGGETLEKDHKFTYTY
ncbi:MAG: hypothetical protein HY064_07645 [Bacteroidetes bacterium]|nr:hypothetical protein [Bacteroidota bacterium]